MARRIVLFEKNGVIMMQREHLAKHPPGNAQQRKKCLKSGWTPAWVAAERARPLDPDAIDQIIEFAIESDLEIERIRIHEETL